MSTHNLLKIAIFVPSSAIGGAEHYVKNILHLIEGVGFQAVLILPKNQQIVNFFTDLKVDYLVSDIAWFGGEEDLNIGNDYLQKLSKQYQETVKILDFLHPDCAFVNLPWVDFGLGISLACHDLQIPCINLVHLCPWKVNLNDLTKQIFQDLAAAKTYFYTVSNDNKIQMSLSTGIDLDLIQVFYNSRDVESEYIGLTSKEYKLHRLELLEELGLPLNSFLSVSVGRFSHQKNFLDIITSFSLVEHKLPNYYHLFLGEGELKEYYQTIASNLGISNKLKFLGYRKDVNRFLALSDLFISTSLYEGLALSILEAAQFSCPIIATNSSSAKEIILNSEYGLLYNPGQYNLLGKYLEFAYFHDREMKKKAEKLKLLCKEKFSLARFKTQLKDILQNSVSGETATQYSPISVSYDRQSRMLKIDSDLDTANYQYQGLPESIVKPADAIAFPLPSQSKELLKQKHEQYLHCLHKVAKQLSYQRVILCFGNFDTNFFRSYYSKEQYLLLIISLQNRDRVTFSVCHIDRTYWGQDLEPECIAKFTTFDTSANFIKFKAKLSKDSPNHYYTAKHLLDRYYKLPNGSSLNDLSINLKMIDSLFKPTKYYLLEKNPMSEKIEMRLVHQ